MADKKRAMKVDKRATKEIRDEGKENFERYIAKYTDKRMFLRLVWKRKVKPCGRECREYGYWIVKEFNNHASFENFKVLPNDEEFLIEAAKISHNPAECPIYFYDYINPYLKRNKNFRLKFLKAMYLNDNVYTLEDVNTIVEYCEMQKENKIILADLQFRKLIEKRVDDLDRVQLEYHCSGEQKQLHKYKVEANDLKVLLENKRKGLTEILNSFTVGEKKEIINPENYYEFLCQQAYKTV